jgi:hypothetical protein
MQTFAFQIIPHPAVYSKIYRINPSFKIACFYTYSVL